MISLDNNNLPSANLQLVEIINTTLKTWLDVWKQQFKNGGTLSLEFSGRLTDLYNIRGDLLNESLTPDSQLRKRCLAAVIAVNSGNRTLGLDFEPRQCSSTSDDSILQLLAAHQDATEHADSIAKPKRSPISRALLVELQELRCLLDRDTTCAEVALTLFDTSTGSFLNETVMVNWSYDMAQRCWTTANGVVVFTDLDDIAHLVLVVRVYAQHNKHSTAVANGGTNAADVRKSSLKNVSKDKLKVDRKTSGGVPSPTSPIRRGLACAVVPLKDNGSTAADVYASNTDSEFHSLHLCIVDQLLQQNNNRVPQSLSLSDSIALTTRIEVIPIFEKPNESFDALPSGVIQANACKNCNDFRNKVFIRLHSADFEKSWKDIEVSAEIVHSKTGAILNGIEQASENTVPTKWRSSATINCSSPKWMEDCTVNLDQIEDHEGSCSEYHVRFLVRLIEKSKERKLVALAFLPLVNKERFLIADEGLHFLTLYKCDSLSKLTPISKYLCLAWNRDQLDLRNGKLIANSSNFVPLLKLYLAVQLTTRTADYSHSSCLLPLCREKASAEEALAVVPRLATLDDAALLPCATLVVRRLLTLLTRASHPAGASSGESDGATDALLGTIVNVLARCHASQVTLQTAQLASFYAAFKLLVNWIVSMLQNALQLDEEVDTTCLRDAIGASILIGEFLCCSNDCKTTEIYQLLIVLYGNLGCFLASEKMPENVKACGWKIATSLPKVKWFAKFAPVQKARVLIAFLDKVDNTSQRHSLFFEESRLNFAVQMHDSLKAQSETLFLYFKPFVLLIRYHLKRRSRLEAATSLLTEMISQIIDQTVATNRRLIRLLTRGILEVLVACCLAVDRSEKIRVRLVSCLFEILRLMSYREYALLVETLRKSDGKKRLKDFLLRLFLIFRNFVRSSKSEPCGVTANSVEQKPFLPLNWRWLYLALCNAALLALQELSDTLCVDFLDGNAFDYQLWSTYLVLCTNFVAHSSLQIEHMLKPNYDKAISRYGDMRLTMAFQLCSLWKHLGRRQSYFIPSMIGPFIDISLIDHPELRRVTIPLIFDLLFKTNETNFKEIEQEVLEKFDNNFAAGKADYNYTKVLKSVVYEKAKKLDRSTSETCDCFITKVDRLMALWTALGQHDSGCLEGIEFTKYEPLFGLMTFYKQQSEMDRRVESRNRTASSLFVRYADRLRRCLEEDGRYAEAASVLRLHADRLKWTSNVILPALEHFPEQPEHQRKTYIYETMIEYFCRAQIWKRAIALTKELTNFYETVTRDYGKLAAALRELATLFENVHNNPTSVDSIDVPYFRLEFFGKDFPEVIQGRKLIYRGRQYDSMASVTERLRLEWPHVQVNTRRSMIYSDEPISDASTPHRIDLRVSLLSVKPEPDEQSKDGEVTVFTYSVNASPPGVGTSAGSRLSRPLSGSDMDSLSRAVDFQNLWTRKVRCVVGGGALPGVLPYLDVVEETCQLVSPVQTACATVKEKNQELRHIVHVNTTAGAGQNAVKQIVANDVQRLLMVLQGAIEAAVNGGIDVYHQAFFTADFCLKNQNEITALSELKGLLWEQADILEMGLTLAKDVIPADCEPLLHHLTSCFARMKKTMKEILNSPRLKRLLDSTVLVSTSKLSLLSSPDQSSMSAAISCPPTMRCQRFSSSIEWPITEREPPPTTGSVIACDSDSVYDNTDVSFGGAADFASESEEELLIRGVTNPAVAMRLQKRTKLQRPVSYNWESSADSVPPLLYGAGSDSYLSDSTTSSPAVLLRKVPSHLRRLADRFSGGAPSTAGSRSCERRPTTSRRSRMLLHGLAGSLGSSSGGGRLAATARGYKAPSGTTASTTAAGADDQGRKLSAPVTPPAARAQRSTSKTPQHAPPPTRSMSSSNDRFT